MYFEAADALAARLGMILAELHGAGAQAKGVARAYDALLDRLGPELPLLTEVPAEELTRSGTALLAEAIARLRAGQVVREAGFDGQFGIVRLFAPHELGSGRRGVH